MTSNPVTSDTGVRPDLGALQDIQYIAIDWDGSIWGFSQKPILTDEKNEWGGEAESCHTYLLYGGLLSEPIPSDIVSRLVFKVVK